MSTATASKWIRVTRRQPCPICGKPDWCLISEDGKAAICARNESDRPAGNKGAGWIHILSQYIRPVTPPPPTTGVKQLPIAPIARRNEVYNALLNELTLTEAHLSNLLKRGLTEEQIPKLGYRSLAVEGRRTAVYHLAKSGLKLAGVPGFYMENGEVRLSGAPGILIPVRDLDSRIAGLQVRADDTRGGKYRWISSKDKPFGCSSGCPVHVARPEGAKDGEVWVTEGPLKADIAAPKLKRMILAVAGVGNWPGVIPIVKALRPGRVVVAYDMDCTSNVVVRHYETELIRALLRLKVKVFEATWNESSKGLDDFILSQGHSA